MAASFIDKARIFCRAGKGGNGAVAFHREKYVSAGGPDGGDGGNGGNIVLVVDDNMSTLMDFRYKRKYVADNGMDGQGARKFGKQGKDLTIRVPRGTVVRDAESNEIIKDMSDSEPFILCRGGKGGWGNAHFATPTRQAPNFAKPGQKCEMTEFELELKSIADVGLVGYPNVGKSTILSVVTAARPKIANYHFTTLAPNLGICRQYGMDFVMADIPGLVEGASEGVGLGHEFLRHVERTKVFIHVVDAAGVELAGAVFGLYDTEACTGEPILRLTAGTTRLSTDDAALAELLPASGKSVTLYLKELSAPAGYRASGEVFPVTLQCAAGEEVRTDDAFVTTLSYSILANESARLLVVNEKLPETPKTGEDSRLWMFSGGLFLLTAAAAAVLICTRKRRRPAHAAK